MNKNQLIFCLVLLFSLFIQKSANSQCGVHPQFALQQGFYLDAININAGPTTFDPSWVAYDWLWKINDQVASTDSILNPNGVLLQTGYSLVSLTVWGTNTITGDSCEKTIANIFQSTSDATFAQMDIGVNGLTVEVMGSFFGGYNSTFNITIDWGDGTVTQGTWGQHTYASSGEYLITFDTGTFSFNGQVSQKVQVNTGLSNLSISNLNNPIPICGPQMLSTPASTPNYISGQYLIEGAGISTNLVFFNYGAQVQIPGGAGVAHVPGQAVLLFNIDDINSFVPIYRVEPIFYDICGVQPDTVSGYVFIDADKDGIKDAGEAPVINKKVNVLSPYLGSTDYYATTDSSGFYQLLVPQSTTYISFSGMAGFFRTIPSDGKYTINTLSTGSLSNLNFGIAQANTTISGRTFLDLNNDSVRNVPPDRNFEYVTIRLYDYSLGRIYTTHANSAGSYTFKVPPGTYSVKAFANSLDSAQIYPDSIVINSSGGTFSNNDFGFYSIVTGNLGVHHYSSSELRPGFDYDAKFKIMNTGIDSISGTLVYEYDSLLTPLSSVPANGVIDNVAHTITWNTGIMAGTESGNYEAVFNLPSTVPLGMVLNFSCNIMPDAGYTDNDLSNNAFTYDHMVIGSFDPNDKNVLPQGKGPDGEVHHDERLFYKIRFQNTGTASAVNVIVQDEIDPDLNINTFRMEGASHVYDLDITDNVATWKFSGIYLPDSNSNEPGSHGYIEYSIVPYQGLPDGTEIENTANIYFDYNTPVVTNTTLNTLQTSLVGLSSYEDENSILLYPIPARDQLIIVSSEFVTQTKVEVLDLAGRTIKTVFVAKSAGGEFIFDVSDLTPGMYFIRIGDMAVRPFIKE